MAEDVKNTDVEVINEVNRGIVSDFDNGNFDILINFADCMGLFTDGFNKEILAHYPQVKVNDERFGVNYGEDPLQGPKGRSIKRLGNYMITEVPRSCGTNGYILTCYIKYFSTIVTEVLPYVKGKDQVRLTNQSPVKYPALYKVFKNIVNRFSNCAIGIPAIRGANKELAKAIINYIFDTLNPNGNTPVFLNFDTDPRFNARKPVNDSKDAVETKGPKKSKKSKNSSKGEKIDNIDQAIADLNAAWNGN